MSSFPYHDKRLTWLILWQSIAANHRFDNHSTRAQYPCHDRKLAFYIPLPAPLSIHILGAASCIIFSKFCGEMWSAELFIKRRMDKDNIVYIHNEMLFTYKEK